MPESFTWTPTIATLPPPSLQTPSASSARASSSLPVFSGLTWAGHPHIATLDPPPLMHMASSMVTPSPLANLSSHHGVEDYLSWHKQFESFLVSHGLLGIPLFRVGLDNL
ncbi:unnamed protein product [Cuscuta europaea]|uniref:Uncharacterized protein n=1 Tax=Cuscuta europaea TaxID=41803 RepID=A0A9P0YN53_CUSEU|nr:unnamed protein product [Cuscuta europaea]